MAMNKKEQAAFAALERELLLQRSWKRTAPVERDLPPPTKYGELSRGWDFRATGYGQPSVHKACSSTVHHGDGWERTTSQQPISLYSTEARALAALRWELEQKAAEQLASIDAQIAALEKQP